MAELMKKNICLTVAYDGTDFHGFQRQTNASSIQLLIEQALSTIFHTKITIYGAARTDAGVHARGQVVNFYAAGTIPTERIPYATKAYLPPEIAILTAEVKPDRFSVRHDNKGKHYRYTIVNRRIHDPFRLRFSWFIRKHLDVEAMQEAAQVLLGTHDFSAFEGQNTTPMNPVKTMRAIDVRKEDYVITIDVIGDGFLYHMVRNIAGALVDVGLHRLTTTDIERILAARDRKQLGATAPPQGLCLEKVFYSQEELDEKVRSLRQ